MGAAVRNGSPRRPSRALVLSGGGARGAYEAGVLSYLLEELPRRLGRPIDAELVLGTSVGAIHACYIAATAHMGAERARRLRRTWLGMQLEDLFHLRPGQLLRLPRRLAGLLRVRAELRGSQPPDKLYGVLDTARLEQLVARSIPWREIRRNLVAGRVGALCVAATQIATGRVVLFVQGRDMRQLRGVQDPTLVAEQARIGPTHALASAAIPVLFPPVRVGDGYYADGGIRLNTPLAPAIHLGAERVLVVALRSRHLAGEVGGERSLERFANPVALYGKLLNTLLLDPLDTDLTRMRLVNSILTSGEKAFGPDFVEEINRVAGRQRRGEGYRVVEELVIRPSCDLGVIAGEVLEAKRASRELSAFVRLLLLGAPLEADLLSYLFFDSEYTARLLELGYQDARAEEERLAAFFSDPA